jgi:hypothetical protein
MEKHYANKNANDDIFSDFLQKRPKFACLNSMNSTFKEIFEQFMKKIL